MPVSRRFDPKGVDLGPAGFLNDDGESRCLDLEKLHKKSPPENYGKEDQTTVAAFLLWRGS